eukprot:g8794.t1
MSSVQSTETAGLSLHGCGAARRQATAELIFFASVGDLERCLRIANTWDLKLEDTSCLDYDKRSPLHVAAANGCYSVVVWLLKEGSPVNAVDRFDRTPLEEAVRGGNKDVVELLILKGAKVMNRNQQLVRLEDSHLSLSSRVLGEFQPEWEIDREDIELKEKIGEGEFGTVYKALWHGTYLAAKLLKSTDSVALADFKTELSMLRKCHHPHTVQFIGAVTREPPFMIITEFMNGGSLADVFNSGITLTIPRACEMALDCAKGMAFLHNSKNSTCFIHRDLKPANLMLGGNKIHNEKHRTMMIKETGRVKIADFGLSRSISTRLYRRHAKSTLGTPSEGTLETKILEEGIDGVTGGYKMTGETGSYRYMAPEVFKHEKYNEKVDVYAFAMIFYQLLQGIPPFVGLDPISAAREAAENGRPMWDRTNTKGMKVPKEMRELVCRCWAPDYEDRPGFLEIVEKIRCYLDGGLKKPPTLSKRLLPFFPKKKATS